MTNEWSCGRAENGRRKCPLRVGRRPSGGSNQRVDNLLPEKGDAAVEHLSKFLVCLDPHREYVGETMF